MTYEAVISMLDECGLPSSYDHFAEGESPDPPFLIFLYPRSNNFSADGSVYKKINELHIELYTEKKDPEIEDRIEAVLNGHGFYYDKTEAWIESEKMYEILYTTEVLSDGGIE